jgi:hypothetical protein
LRVPWDSKEDDLEAVREVGAREMVAMGASSSASLYQEMAEAGLRAPLASRAQDSEFTLDMFNQER